MSSSKHSLRLGVNIDHVATIRNARGGAHPDPLRAAEMAVAAGADGITIHLREDRRHITDADLVALKNGIHVPINLEMAATDEMLAIALGQKPHAVCLVPERRAERTTEGGLDVAANQAIIGAICTKLRAAGIRVSLFIAADKAQIQAAKKIGADIVEFHTGPYAHAHGAAQLAELKKIQDGVALAAQLGLECHAGHGLNYHNVAAIAAIKPIVELNIGHFLIGEAVFTGLAASVQEMRRLMQRARGAA
jgi:pyridoxine 5-phosphate synthase